METKKFKVGDVCTVKDKKTCFTFYNADGCAVRIISVSEDRGYSYEVLDKNGKNVTSCFRCLDDDELELLPEGSLIPDGEKKEEEPVKTHVDLKFKVGDVVKVRTDLRHIDYDNGIHFSTNMRVYQGQTMTITERTNTYYKCSGNTWSWTDSMLETVGQKVPDPQEPEFRVGDRVEHNKGLATAPVNQVSQTESSLKGGEIMGTSLNTLAEKLLDDDTKTLVKEGVLDACLNVTSSGQVYLNSFLVNQYKKELALELVTARKKARKERKEDEV